MVEAAQTVPLPTSSVRAHALTVLLITGMSGAGRSTSLKMLEDLGYEAVDNLPLSLLPPLFDSREDSGSGQPRAIAVGIDFRTRDFNVSSLCGEIERLTVARGLDCRLVFLDCDDEILARRFTETRRRHPLAIDRPVPDGIRLERALLARLRERADMVVDTSTLHLPDLRRFLAGHFALQGGAGLQLYLTSFAFREGLPREADLVFDVRFLDNPHYRDDLRALTGLDPAVGEAVAADPAWGRFFTALTQLIETLLPGYAREGKSYLTIAMGCTGGRHRSVYAAERLAEWLRANGQKVTLGHRDLLLPLSPRDGRVAEGAPKSETDILPDTSRVCPGASRRTFE
jgi:UPF0042 nucleotide-binding protein